MADQVVRMLDEESVTPPDRLRILLLYILFRDGILPADMQKLLAHAGLPPQNADIVQNLDLLGAHTKRGLKDIRPTPPSLFPTKAPPVSLQDDYALSRYEPALQTMLESAATGVLDPETFPYTKPPLDMGEVGRQQSATSLRAAKPTWARTRTNASTENRQRCIVFIAGGATYSESRACYETGQKAGREVFLVTSHMLTPALFVRQVGDLSMERRRLGIPADQPKPKAPAHLFEPDPKPKAVVAPVQQPQVPVQQMGGMNLTGGTAVRPLQPPVQAPVQANSSAKLTKENPEKEKKKKHHFFGKKDKS
jgi:syntaxin-binding protein 1